MVNDDIYIKLKDLFKLLVKIEKDERVLIERQANIAISKRNINKIISAHRNEKRETVVIFPKNYIPIYQDNSKLNSAFSWKKMIHESAFSNTF